METPSLLHDGSVCLQLLAHAEIYINVRDVLYLLLNGIQRDVEYVFGHLLAQPHHLNPIWKIQKDRTSQLDIFTVHSRTEATKRRETKVFLKLSSRLHRDVYKSPKLLPQLPALQSPLSNLSANKSPLSLVQRLHIPILLFGGEFVQN